MCLTNNPRQPMVCHDEIPFGPSSVRTYHKAKASVNSHSASVFRCVPCGIYHFTGQKQLEEHLKGSKHQQNLLEAKFGNLRSSEQNSCELASMFDDPHPPTKFTPADWNAARKKLTQSNFTQIAKEMENLQQNYTNRTVAISGIHIAELFVSTKLQSQDTLNNKIWQLRDSRTISQTLADQLHFLREMGNREKHANTERKFAAADKPAVVHTVFAVAMALAPELHPSPPSSRSQTSNQPSNSSAPSALALDVPSSKFAILCGAKFSTAQRLMEYHEVKLTVPRSATDVPRYVTISGPDEGVHECMEEMSRMLYYPVRFLRDVPSARPPSPEELNQYHPPTRVKKTLPVTAAVRAFVLTRRQEDEQKFDVKISASPPSADTTVVNVQGHSASVNRACKYFEGLQTRELGPHMEVNVTAARALKNLLMAEARAIKDLENNDVLVNVSQQGLAVTCTLVASPEWPTVLNNAVQRVSDTMRDFTVSQHTIDDAPSLIKKFRNREERVRMQQDYSLALVALDEPDFSVPVPLNVPWDKYGLVVARRKALYQSHPRVVILIPPRESQTMTNIKPITINTRQDGCRSDIVEALASIKELVRQPVLERPLPHSSLVLCGATTGAVEKAVEALKDMQRGLRPVTQQVTWPTGSSLNYSWMKHLLPAALQTELERLQKRHGTALRFQTATKGINAVTFHGPQEVVDDCKKSIETWLLQKF